MVHNLSGFGGSSQGSDNGCNLSAWGISTRLLTALTTGCLNLGIGATVWSEFNFNSEWTLFLILCLAGTATANGCLDSVIDGNLFVIVDVEGTGCVDDVPSGIKSISNAWVEVIVAGQLLLLLITFRFGNLWIKINKMENE